MAADLSRRAALTLSAAFGASTVVGTANAAPLDNLCRQVPAPQPLTPAHDMLVRMTCAGSIITTLQEGSNPEIEAGLGDLAAQGWIVLERRRNPPRVWPGAQIDIGGCPVSGAYSLEMDDGWTLLVRTTVLGKIEGLSRGLRQTQDEVDVWRSFAEETASDLMLFDWDRPENMRLGPFDEDALLRIAEEPDASRDPKVQLSGWELMAQGLVRPEIAIMQCGGMCRTVWGLTDYGRFFVAPYRYPAFNGA